MVAEMAASKVLRVGLVGAGFLARTRARCWRRVHGSADGRLAGVELAGVSSRTSEVGAAFAAEFGVPRHFETADELFASDEIDLVDLCVPNRLHRPLAERAAAAGKAILCTKPLTAYVGQDLDGNADPARTPRARMLEVAVGDARAMVAAAERHGVPLFYGENWATAPALEKAVELGRKARGRILDMRGWECHSGSHTAYSADWGHTGGGALLRLGAHPVGAMLWLKRLEGLARDGRPVRPVSVTGEVADPKGVAGLGTAGDPLRGVEGWGTLVLAFEDGSRGVAMGSDTMVGGMQSRLVVLAGDHHLECNLSPHDGLRAYGRGEGVFGDAYIMEKVDGQSGWSTPIPDEDWTSGQQGLCQKVAEAAVSGPAHGGDSLPQVPDGALGLDVVRCIYAAYQSAEEGRRIALEAPGRG